MDLDLIGHRYQIAWKVQPSILPEITKCEDRDFYGTWNEPELVDVRR